MISSRTENKIYAFLSILAIILIFGSFALVVDFLLKINKYIFSVNEQIVKEKTTILDKAGFNKLKEKLNADGMEEKKPSSEINTEE